MVDIETKEDFKIIDGTLQTVSDTSQGGNAEGEGDGSVQQGETQSKENGNGDMPDNAPDGLKSTDTDPNDLQVGDKFYGTIKTAIRDKNGKPFRTSLTSVFTVTDRVNDQLTVKATSGAEYKTSTKAISIENLSEVLEKKRKSLEEQRKKEEEKRKKEEAEAFRKANEFDFSKLSAEEKVRRTIKSGINNIWMVGPAGCGKSTIARNVAAELEMPYLCISCGIGTSAVEFVGYKYPNRESTKFSEYYQKPSVILIDEMTALDPAVAQVINAALANNEIETTTGLVQRHPDCIIIATSNTFGAGASRQYVANN